MQIDLFNSLVSPILSHGSEVWGVQKADEIDKIHISFLRTLLCVKSSTPSCFVYGELGTYPLGIERKIRVVKYWLKVISSGMENNNYVGKVYLELYQLSIEKPDITTWCTQVKDILFSSGFGYVWVNQSVHDCKDFLRMFSLRLHDMYLQEWSTNVSLTSENRLFKFIKEEFSYESYLNINNKTVRIALSRVRLSSHLFMIERGRWGKNKLQVRARKCSLCGVIEDEFHCLMVCPRFNNERKWFLDKIFPVQPSNYDFINLLKQNNDVSNLNLAILCYKVQNAYNEFI